MPYETALTLLPAILAVRGPDAPRDRETRRRGTRTAICLRGGNGIAKVAHDN